MITATQNITPTMLFGQRFGITVARHRNKYRVIGVSDTHNVHVESRRIQVGDIIETLDNRNLQDCTEFDHFRNISELAPVMQQHRAQERRE